MSINLNVPASVQYGDWIGTTAADEVDTRELEKFLGVDRSEWRLLVFDITIYGGFQEVTGYGVRADVTWNDLEALTESNRPIVVHRVGVLEYDTRHGDTNPPPPLTLPVISAGELLGHGFKRLHIRMRSRNIPDGAVIDVAE